MKISSVFAVVLAVAATVVAISGCGSVGPAPVASSIPVPPNATPPARWLYVNHNGTFSSYSLPLVRGSKPVRTLTEWPGLGIAPVLAVGPYGDVAIASPQSIRFFRPPIVSFDPSRAYLKLKLTPAITEVGVNGAFLVDLQYDPNDNLWLFNNLGADITELAAPITRKSVAQLSIAFGVPGSKTAGFSTLVQGRFDVNATLYVYASSAARSRLFKIAFPYAKPPGSTGLSLAQADFVNSSQYLPTSHNPASVLLGQYFGALASPKPGSPPSPPVNVMSQFDEPLDPFRGLFPNEIVKTIVGALAADPPREQFYTLEAANGRLGVYGLPLRGGAKPTIGLPCLDGTQNCNGVGEHLFLAP